jgi:hypothetical protein
MLIVNQGNPNRELKKMFRLNAEERIERYQIQGKYKDRAAERRDLHGPEKFVDDSRQDYIPALPEQSLTEHNPGFKMLQGMGWQVGKGLGRSEHGIVDPVEVSFFNS